MFKVALSGSPITIRATSRRSTWQMIAGSCPTALGVLCGQLTFPLARCHVHIRQLCTVWTSHVDCGTLFWSSCAIPTSPTDCSRGNTFFAYHASTRRIVTYDMRRVRKKTFTYLLVTYLLNSLIVCNLIC